VLFFYAHYGVQMLQGLLFAAALTIPWHGPTQRQQQEQQQQQHPQ
jgi:hypothetical protein